MFACAIAGSQALCGASAGATDATPDASPQPAASATPAAERANDPCDGSDQLLATIDRPTIGFSVCAVPRGAVVLEEGFQESARGGFAPSVTSVYPEGFERIGVADRFEIDVIGPNFNRMRAGSTLTTGYSDLGLGFKLELPPRTRFTYAFDGLVTAATGTGGFGYGGPSETLNADVAYTLSPAMGVATTLAGSSSASGAVRYGTFNPSVVVTAQTPSDAQVFAELGADTKNGPQAGGRAFTDFGVQKLLGHHLEIDVEYGLDLTPVAGARSHYVGTGLGLRVI